MTSETSARRATYGELWRRVPGTAAYLLLALVTAIVGLATTAALFFLGLGTAILVLGVPILACSLLVARGFGAAERRLLTLTGLPPIAEPAWEREPPGQRGFWRRVLRPARNPHYWTALVHQILVLPIVSIATFAIGAVWIGVALGGLTMWAWEGTIPDQAGRGIWGGALVESIPWLFGGWSAEAVEHTLTISGGALFAVTLPWILRGLAWIPHSTASGLLGRWASDDLAEELRAESAARGAAVQAENVSLRRLERDIHDGPQQRLVRLQMDLAAVERRSAAGDAAGAAAIARDAGEQARTALDELRALSSGVAPPLLQDRGLSAALAAIADDAAIRVETDIAAGVDAVLADEVARNVYFIAAELVTNAVKHSGAHSASLSVFLRDAANPAGERLLDVRVRDDGSGGASMRPGHGLAGLSERVAGLRGTFFLDSPPGGPTVAGAYIPVATGAAPTGHVG